MSKFERQEQILHYLYSNSRILVTDLSAKFQVSNDTIRRDLDELEQQGILKRTHGGAVPSKRSTPQMDHRLLIHKDDKFCVAKKAVSYLQRDSLIAIDGGTTNLYFASLIPLSMKLRVVTNSFPVAEELRKRPNISVYFLGGYYNKESQTTTGESVLQQLDNYHFDQCFLGAYAIDSEIGVTVPYPYEDEASVKRKIVASSNQINVMGLTSKLNKCSNYKVCTLTEADRILCETLPEANIQAIYQNKLF